MLRMRPCSTVSPAHSALRISVDSASRPMCQAQRASSILRSGFTDTSTPWKCRTQASITWHSASSAARP